MKINTLQKTNYKSLCLEFETYFISSTGKISFSQKMNCISSTYHNSLFLLLALRATI